MPDNLLAPAAALVLWTLIMLHWATVARFGAFATAGADLKSAPAGGRGADLEYILPPIANWKSHSHTRLLERPTLLCAVIILLFSAAGDTPHAQWVPSAYLALRIVHSLLTAHDQQNSVSFQNFHPVGAVLAGSDVVGAGIDVRRLSAPARSCSALRLRLPRPE